MKTTVSINAHYPVVQYGNAEVKLTFEMEDRDMPGLPQGMDPIAKAIHLNHTARYIVQSEWVKLRDEVEKNILDKLCRLLPDHVEQKLILEGRIKR